MKGSETPRSLRETTRSLPEMTLFYLYEGPRDLPEASFSLLESLLETNLFD